MHAECVSENELDQDGGCVWYLPHHGVYHPKKPQKIEWYLTVVLSIRASRHLLQEQI